MSGKDKILASQVHHKNIRLERAEFIPGTQSSSEEEMSTSSSQHSQLSGGQSTDFEIMESHETTSMREFIDLKAPRRIMDNAEVSGTIDRIKLSDGQATMMVASVIKACGGDVNEFILSRSSTYRVRKTIRVQIAQEIIAEVASSPPENIALHWDGKLLSDRLGNKYDALAVVASAYPKFIEGKLLGIQKIENASGKAQAEASMEMLESWNLVDKTKVLVFDTTASNSGWKKGAARLLEQHLGRKVFYHACRHHIYELIVGAVWKRLFGIETTGPENKAFNSFKSRWDKIDKTKPFVTLQVPDCLEEKRASTIKMLSDLLITKDAFIRDDYKECVTNTLGLLGERTPRHHRPGATHSARWMGTILYCQKMFLWCRQMEYDTDYITLLSRINIFLALYYVPAWMRSSHGRDAAVNDLFFIRDMIGFGAVDPAISESALYKIKKHLWYLQEETVIYSLFTSRHEVTKEMKEEMAKALLQVPQPASFRMGIPVMRKDVTVTTVLTDLIGPDSWFLFHALNLEHDWLALPADKWETNASFLRAKNFVSNVKVVNDAAERNIKLITDYATILTDNDEQRASLLQAVESHRQKYPDFSKSTLSGK